MTEPPRGWQLLHSKLPSAAIKPLATAVYGVAGLSDVNEGFLIQRLFASELPWEWRILKESYLGSEERTNQAGKPYSVYLAAVHGELSIQNRQFHGVGASDNRKVDAAFKGAATVAFKNACKVAGLTAELYLDGRAIDHIYSERIPRDKEMAPASVDQLVNQIEEVYGPPEEAAQGERSEPEAVPGTPAMTPAPPQQETQDGRTSVAPKESSGMSSPPSASPAVLGTEDLQPLYTLARTLKNPRTAADVDAKVQKHGLKAVRLELVMAHSRDCKKQPCEHIAELAGLK